MLLDIYLKFISPEPAEKHSSLVVSRIKNINSIAFIIDPAGSYLKFNLADGSSPSCLWLDNDIEELHEHMGPLARFDDPVGLFFNPKNLSSFHFLRKGTTYQLNMAYFKGSQDCFNVGDFTTEQFQKIPISEFFEE